MPWEDDPRDLVASGGLIKDAESMSRMFPFLRAPLITRKPSSHVPHRGSPRSVSPVRQRMASSPPSPPFGPLRNPPQRMRPFPMFATGTQHQYMIPPRQRSPPRNNYFQRGGPPAFRRAGPGGRYVMNRPGSPNFMNRPRSPNFGPVNNGLWGSYHTAVPPAFNQAPPPPPIMSTKRLMQPQHQDGIRASFELRLSHGIFQILLVSDCISAAEMGSYLCLTLNRAQVRTLKEYVPSDWSLV